MKNLFETIISEDNVRLAIKLALNDASKEVFTNPIQIEHCRAHESLYTKRVMARLSDYQNYENKVSVRAMKRKNEFTLRTFIIPDIEDVIARTAVALVIANELEAKLIDNCFANRRGDQIKQNNSLTEDFAKHSWKRFCEWQAEAADKYAMLLKTDLSSFYDSISHDHLINSLLTEFVISDHDPLIVLLRKMLKIKHVYSIENEPLEVIHGITIGPHGNQVFANLLLNRIDHEMQAYPGVKYGRYVDDIRIFGNNIISIKHALNHLQILLYNIGLNLNGAKTKFAGRKDLLNRLISERFFTYIDENEDSPSREPSPSRMRRLSEDLENYHFSRRSDIDLPFHRDHPSLLSWKKVRLSRNPDLLKKYLHSVNRAIEIEPETVDKRVENRLIQAMINDPDNEKFAAWLISRMILEPGISKIRRKSLLRRILELMSALKLPSYSIYRILYFLSNQQKYSRFDYCVVNKALGSDMKDLFTQVLNRCLNNDRLILNLIGLFALRAYNDNHSKAQRIKLVLKKPECQNNVWDDNLKLAKKLPKLTQEIMDVSELISRIPNAPDDKTALSMRVTNEPVVMSVEAETVNSVKIEI